MSLKSKWVKVLAKSIRNILKLLNRKATSLPGYIAYKLDKDILKELSKNTKSFRISLIDKNGQVLFDTYENPKFLPTHKDRPEFQNAKKFGFAQSKRFSTTLSTDSYYVSFLLNNDQVLRLSKEVDSIMGAFLKILPLLLTISFAIFLIISFLSNSCFL